MNLKISDQALHQALQSKAQQERTLTKEIIIYIEEVIRRKLYLKLGCSSLHQYLTDKIGYSEGSAQRRIDAARIISAVPEVSAAIEDGRLKLTQISKVQQIVRDLKKAGKPVDVQKQKEVLAMIENKKSRATDLILSQEFDIAIKIYDKKKTQKDESVRLEMTFSKEEMELIEEAQAILSNKTGGKLRDTIVEMAKRVIKDSKPKVKLPFKESKTSELKISVSNTLETKKPETSTSNTSNIPAFKLSNASGPKTLQSHSLKNTNSINTNLTPTSAAEVAVRNQEVKELKSVTPRLKKQLKLRDHVCQFIDPITKKQCGSRFFLQADHIRPKYLDGPNSMENLRMLCKNHNIFRYERGL